MCASVRVRRTPSQCTKRTDTCVFPAHSARMSSVAIRLKELRRRATPRLTVRGMAEKLGLPLSSYARYETPEKYKKPHLPLDFARRLATVLADHSIDPAQVLELAGVGIDEAGPPVLSAGEEQLLGRFRDLDPDQRRLLIEMAEAMGNRPAPGSLRRRKPDTAADPLRASPAR